MHAYAIRIWLQAVGRVTDANDRARERGLATTEIAVLTFVLIAIAIAIGTVLYNNAADTVSNAPATDIPDFGD